MKLSGSDDLFPKTDLCAFFPGVQVFDLFFGQHVNVYAHGFKYDAGDKSADQKTAGGKNLRLFFFYKTILWTNNETFHTGPAVIELRP